MEDLPAWLETLFNVNPSLAERALVDVKRWMEIEKLINEHIEKRKHEKNNQGMGA